MSRKKRILVVIAVLAAAGLVWFFVHRARSGDGELKLYGNVDIREVDLAFRVPGRLGRVLVDEGDAVKAGELVAELDARPYKDALDKASAGRDVAAANLAKYRAGYRKENIAQARAQVAQYAAEYKNAVIVARRRGKLLRNRAIAAQDYDDAVASRDALKAQLENAQKGLQLQLAGYRREDVQSAAASFRSAEAAEASARTDLDDTRLYAPSAGTVLSRVREPGAMAEAGANILVLSLDRPVRVRAYVPEKLLGRVSQGMALLVYTDGRPGRPYHGTVGFISPVAEFTPKSVETETLRTALVYRLRVIVHDADSGLRQGMPVTLRPDHDHSAAAARPAAAGPAGNPKARQ